MGNVVEALERYTYRDYKKWDESFRCELIYGEVYMMSAPDIWHQRMVLSLGSQLREFLVNKPCEPFISPFDVRLFPQQDESDDVVVQPDVLVICDKQKLSDGKACSGAPDFVIEVISHTTKAADMFVKNKIIQ